VNAGQQADRSLLPSAHASDGLSYTARNTHAKCKAERMADTSEASSSEGLGDTGIRGGRAEVIIVEDVAGESEASALQASAATAAHVTGASGAEGAAQGSHLGAFALMRQAAMLEKESSKKTGSKRTISESNDRDSDAASVIGKNPARAVIGRQRKTSLSASRLESAENSDGGSSSGSKRSVKRVKTTAPKVENLMAKTRIKEHKDQSIVYDEKTKVLKCDACDFFLDGHKSHVRDHAESEGHKKPPRISPALRAFSAT
jgi:hypothetical protein